VSAARRAAAARTADAQDDGDAQDEEDQAHEESQADEEDPAREEGEAGEEDAESGPRPQGLTMQVKENWSHVVGRVEKWTAPKGPDEPGELVVRVERVADVKGEGGKPWPNMLDDAEGSTLRVQVPASAAAGLDAAGGASVTVDVRRGREPGLVFANPESLRVSSR
jgi:hypothetical protein